MVGLGGIGKSRLALELAYRAQSDKSSRSVFWVQATDVAAFERDILEIGKMLKIPGIDDDKADVKSLVRQWLNSSAAGKWLMILDNADDESIWGKNQLSNGPDSSLAAYLPMGSSSGSILITTRTRQVATYQSGRNVVELHEMNHDDAVGVLQSLLEAPDIASDSEATSDLLQKLTYLPLAIRHTSNARMRGIMRQGFGC